MQRCSKPVHQQYMHQQYTSTVYNQVTPLRPIFQNVQHSPRSISWTVRLGRNTLPCNFERGRNGGDPASELVRSTGQSNRTGHGRPPANWSGLLCRALAPKNGSAPPAGNPRSSRTPEHLVPHFPARSCLLVLENSPRVQRQSCSRRRLWSKNLCTLLSLAYVSVCFVVSRNE